MKSWKSRLLMVLTVVAVILAVSVPAMADIEVECEADDGICKERVNYESQYGDTGSEEQGGIVVEPVVEGSGEECFPFCGLEWWPY